MEKLKIMINTISIVLIFSSLVLAQTGSIEGYVISGDGTPWEAADVAIVDPPDTVMATTDVNGFYSRQNLLPASYTFVINHPSLPEPLEIEDNPVTVISGKNVPHNLVISPEPMTVYDPKDYGPFSLRQMITDANTNAGLDVISFLIPGDSTTIRPTPTSPLPVITDPIVIDGMTQPGYSGSPIIELSSSIVGSGDGLSLSGGNSEIIGIAINYFFTGIYISVNGNNIIKRCYIGTDITGLIAMPNVNGITIMGVGNNYIGISDNPGDRNLISGNSQYGVYITTPGATDNHVINNYIGTDITGTAALGNGSDGVQINNASDNYVGSNFAGTGNLISGNGNNGIDIHGSEAENNYIQGNIIGLDATGSSIIENGYDGIFISSEAHHNWIGGTTTDARNIISGNVREGILIYDDSHHNKVKGNFIGTDITGTLPRGNQIGGIRIGTLGGNMIGGLTPAERNIISGNQGNGILLNSSANDTIMGNYIGTSADGLLPIANDGHGIKIEVNSSNNYIGLGREGPGNFIAANNGSGIQILDADNNYILGNYIGTNTNSSVDLGNEEDGIFIGVGRSNIIGGNDPAERNIISGNGDNGIEFVYEQTLDNEIYGNYIGTNVEGNGALPNSVGIYIWNNAYNNIIGGTSIGAGNVISGNTEQGIFMANIPANGNTVQGNYIGLDVTGLSKISNGSEGVMLQRSSNNLIGGSAAGSENYISGNSRNGIWLEDNANGNKIIGNFIGTFITGIGDQSTSGNDGNGIQIRGSNDNIIGGYSDQERNIISANQGSGIYIINSVNYTIINNYIGTNVNGTGDLGNAQYGIYILNAANNSTGMGVFDNLISGNDWGGITIYGNGSTNIRISGNFIGTDATGSSGLGNSGYGIRIDNAPSNTIGGVPQADFRNIISSNTEAGIHISGNTASQNTIVGNYIGTDVNGTTALPNLFGIYIMNGASSNTIGGVPQADCNNIISGNTVAGIVIADPTTSRNTIVGNYIGTDISGTIDLGNQTHGIHINDAPENFIGINLENAANVIAGNNAVGIVIEGSNATGNIVWGNFIGTNAAGNAALENGTVPLTDDYAIRINGSSDNIIGGFEGHRNIICGGVLLDGANAMRNKLIGNYIGIDITGNTSLEAVGHGVQIGGGSQNEIGPANVISGHVWSGIDIINTTENRVIGNLIGTNATGLTAIPNGWGIFLSATSDNIIGGPTIEERNLISGNLADGIVVEGNSASGNTIIGNFIGTGISGDNSLENMANGIYLNGAPDNRIGGKSLDSANVISGNFSDGILIGSIDATGNQVLGNFIGTDITGTITVKNEGAGISINNAPENIIGGIDPEAKNIIYGGMVITNAEAQRNRVMGNYVGVDITGNSALGDGDDLITGLWIEDASENEIGPNNVISGHGEQGIMITNSGSTLNKIFGNLIGTNYDGDEAIPNRNGISITNAPGNRIGGSTSSDGNIISGNLFDGIVLTGLASQYDTISYNHIGTDVTGYYDLPNQQHGIEINAANNAIINGNRIAYNKGCGVTVVQGEQNLISENSIFSNEALGIDLGDDGITENDPDDSDTGPNTLQNFPELTSVEFNTSGGNVTATVSGTLNSTPNTEIVLEFFANTTGDPTGYGEGHYYLGAYTVNTGSGNTEFSTPPLDLYGGKVISATATDPNHNTSEFSQKVGGVEQPVVETGNFSLDYVINKAGAPTIKGNSDIDAIKNAFQNWENIATSEASFNYKGFTDKRYAAYDSVNLVTFSDDSWQDVGRYVLAFVAKTIVVEGNEGRIVDADIVFNSRFNYSTDGKEDTYDLESVATHEIGHILGLLHSGVKTATMFFILQPKQEARSLEVDDIAWASYLYPNSQYHETFCEVQGQVTDGYSVSDGNGIEPVAGALLLATNTITSDSVHAYSNEYGSYVVPGLATGDYTISLQPLDGDVHNLPLRPGYVSEYLNANTTITDYPHEFYDASESEIDDPEESEPVSVTIAESPVTINLITNLDIIPPEIVMISPEDQAENISVRPEIKIVFSEPVNQESFAEAFKLTAVVNPTEETTIPVTYNFIDNEQKTVLVTAHTDYLPLRNHTVYKIYINRRLKDMRDNYMREESVTSFRTEVPDPPTVTIHPGDEAENISLNAKITLEFSEPMDRNTFTIKTNPQQQGNFSLSSGNNYVDGTFKFQDSCAVFTPLRSLDAGAPYTLYLRTGILDQNGNGLEHDIISTFTTRPEGPPFITEMGPGDGDTDVTVSTAVFADFSEPINVETISSETFRLTDGNNEGVTGTFTYLFDDSRVVFRPDQDLDPKTQYRFQITNGITDCQESPLYFHDENQTDTLIIFTTEDPPDPNAPPMIESIVEPRAPVGTNVAIGGKGFDPDTSKNLVYFEGSREPALVKDASLTGLIVKVPYDAEEGSVIVEVNGKRSDPFPFYIASLSSEPANEILARAPIERGGRDSRPTPDGTLAYVVNSLENSVSVIDLSTLETIDHIEVGYDPRKIDINPAGTRAYVTNYMSNTVSVICTDRDAGVDSLNKVINTIRVGLGPIGIAVTPDRRVYVANFISRDVSEIDVVPESGTENQVIASKYTDSGNRDIDINPDGTRAFITGTRGVLILNIDFEAPEEIHNSMIARAASERETGEIVVSPDGYLVFATTLDGKYIIIIDAHATENSEPALANIRTEREGKDLDIGPDGLFLYVTNIDNTVSVYKITYLYNGSFNGVTTPFDGPMIGEDQPDVTFEVALTLVAVIELGEEPPLDGIYGISIDPVGYKAIVVNSEYIWTIDISPVTTAKSVNKLITDIEDLLANGILKQSDANSLLNLLEAAADLIETGNDVAAKDKLTTFIHKVEELVKKGKLADENGQTLIDRANGIIEQIDTNLKKTRDQEEDLVSVIPDKFELNQNYPNPFNPITTISFNIPVKVKEGVPVEIKIFNILGEVVRTLVDEIKTPGSYAVTWDGKDANGMNMASGIYIYRIKAGDFTQVKKMVLIR